MKNTHGVARRRSRTGKGTRKGTVGSGPKIGADGSKPGQRAEKIAGESGDAEDGNASGLKSAETMAQGAAILSAENPVWTLAAVKWAKRQGCEAFRGPRVYLREFREWWRENGSEYLESELKAEDVLDRELKQDKLARLRKLDEIDDGKWLPAKEAYAEMQRLGIEQRSTLTAKLEIELPPKLVGQDVITITERLKGAVDDICRIFETGVARFAPAVVGAPEYMI